MGVRRVRNSGGNIIGAFPSIKMHGQVPYESTIERDLLFFLEYDPAVVSYQAQPFVITDTSVDGSTHTYTPDFHVTRTTSNEVVECKPASQLGRAHTQQQIALGQAWADANQHLFVVITDLDLRAGHQLANLKLLWRYSRLSAPVDITRQCRVFLDEQRDGLSLESLAALLSNASSASTLLPYLYALLFRHVLSTDLTQPLSSATCVWLPSHPH